MKGNIIFLFVLTVLFQQANAQRDPFTWPFAVNSIWNTPIGSNAVYKPAYLRPVAEIGLSKEYGFGGVGVDDEPILIATASDPMMELTAPAKWNFRCGGKPTGKQYRFPEKAVYKDPNGSRNTPNFSGVCLQPDGSLFHFNAVATCGNNMIAAYDYTSKENNSLFSPGHTGGHGGSGLSGIGGSIRKGELLASEPIHHAIKLNILAAYYLVYNNDATPGYRWPAVKADGYADPSKNPVGGYGVKNLRKADVPYMEMGALLAINPFATPRSLGITNPIAIKLFYALQNYGAYIVDDTYWNNYDLPLEEGVAEEVLSATGINIANRDLSSSYSKDMMTIIQNLQCVVNNAPESIGGGGKPRQPLAPPFEHANAN